MPTLLVDAGALVQEIGTLRNELTVLEATIGLSSPSNKTNPSSLAKSKLAADFLAGPSPLLGFHSPSGSPTTRRPQNAFAITNRAASPDDRMSTRSSEFNPPHPPLTAPPKPSHHSPPIRPPKHDGGTRGEAVILEAALDQALPPGAFRAKHYHPLNPKSLQLSSPTSNLKGRSQSSLGSYHALTAASDPTRAFLSSSDPDRDFEALEAVQKEVARQASASCADHGRILIKASERYREVYEVLR